MTPPRPSALRALALAGILIAFCCAAPAALHAIPAGEGPTGAIELGAGASPDSASDTTTAGALAPLGARSGAPGGPPGPAALLLRMFAALALVLGLVIAAAYLLKRYGGRLMGTTPAGRADAIRIVSTKLLGGRRSLMLVRVRGQTLLLGVTPQAINCLTEIHDLEGEWAQPADSEGPAPTPFERHLGRNVDRTVGPDDSGL